MFAHGNASVIRHLETNLVVGLVGAAAAVEVAITVPGAAIGDAVVFNADQANATGIVFAGGRVTAPNTVALRFCNPTAGGLTPPATDDYNVFVLQARGASSP